MTNFFNALYTIWLRELIRYWRDKIRIVTTLVQPLMFLAIFGVGLSSTLSQQNFGVSFIKYMYPGIIAMGVMGVAFFSTISTVWDREFGFLKEILVAPVSRTSIAIGKTLGAMTISITQAVLLFLIAPLVGIEITGGMIPGIIMLTVLLGFAISGIGLLIASLMKSMESFGLIMQILIFPMFFLSGAFFPLTDVPVWMSVIARINPLSYGVEGLRSILLGQTLSPAVLQKFTVFSIPIDAVALAIFSVVLIAAAVAAFNKEN